VIDVVGGDNARLAALRPGYVGCSMHRHTSPWYRLIVPHLIYSARRLDPVSDSRVGPESFTQAAHRSGRDTLASSGSYHRVKTAAFRREMGLFLLPVGPPPTSVTCPLGSTGITPLPRYYGAVRPCPPHRYFRPRRFAACTFSLGIVGQVLKFRTRARMRVMPPIHRTPRGQ
jgi:hypothetical protein